LRAPLAAPIDVADVLRSLATLVRHRR
jgi:hypothetical protein